MVPFESTMSLCWMTSGVEKLRFMWRLDVEEMWTAFRFVVIEGAAVDSTGTRMMD